MSTDQTKTLSSVKISSVIFALLTANVGHTIHGSTVWSIVDFFLFPLVWLKWIIFHEVTLSIIEKSFDWFLK